MRSGVPNAANDLATEAVSLVKLPVGNGVDGFDKADGRRRRLCHPSS